MNIITRIRLGLRLVDEIEEAVNAGEKFVAYVRQHTEPGSPVFKAAAQFEKETMDVYRTVREVLGRRST